MTIHSRTHEGSFSEEVIRRLDNRLSVLQKTAGYRTQSQHLLAHSPGLFEDFYDFDVQVQAPSGLTDVTARYVAEINRFASMQEVSFLAFIDKGKGLTTGAILLSTLLSDRTGLPFALVYPGKDLDLEKVKWPGVYSKYATMEGESGILLTDHVSSGKEIEGACQAIHERGGKINHVIAYSAYKNRVREGIGGFLRENDISFFHFSTCLEGKVD